MFTADLHIHGRFSRGTSKDLTIKTLEKYARIKGIDLLGTGDFTHPEWFSEIKNELTFDSGVFKTKSGFPFILTTEVSLVYSDSGKGRRVHLIVLAPDLGTAEQITEYLKTKGRVDYDGRPIFNIPCPDFAGKMAEINSEIEIIPAHIWTPWFSLFGSKSGFNSVKECFKEQTGQIHALETGLSSDPMMNWRLSQLDKYTMVSFSDLHSYWPWRIGREATIFNGEVSYETIIRELRNNSIYGTIEVDPAYGKYHFDGHRLCNVVMSPKESRRVNMICPVCGKPLTIGVDFRVNELADREEGYELGKHPKVYRLIPLSELISAVYNVAVSSKKQWEIFNKFCSGRTELDVLLRMPEEELKKIDEKLAGMIMLNRAGKISVKPGYDGVYGEPIFEGAERKEIKKPAEKQARLANF